MAQSKKKLLKFKDNKKLIQKKDQLLLFGLSPNSFMYTIDLQRYTMY